MRSDLSCRSSPLFILTVGASRPAHPRVAAVLLQQAVCTPGPAVRGVCVLGRREEGGHGHRSVVCSGGFPHLVMHLFKKNLHFPMTEHLRGVPGRGLCLPRSVPPGDVARGHGWEGNCEKCRDGDRRCPHLVVVARQLRTMSDH